jgi:hypothetical protein
MVTAAYRAKHPDRVKAQKAKAWAKHAERFKEVQRRYKLRKPWAHMLAKARIRARGAGLAFELTHEWAKARWTGHCEVTGIPFTMWVGTTVATSPSLDRIDPSRGYVDGNCRFVLWAVNRFKGDGSDAEMLAIARELVKGI